MQNTISARLNAHFSHPAARSAPRQESVGAAFSSHAEQVEALEEFVQADNQPGDLNLNPRQVRFAADETGLEQSVEWSGHKRSGWLQSETKSADGSFSEIAETRFGPFGMERRQVVESAEGIRGTYQSVDVSEHEYCYSREFFIPAAPRPQASEMKQALGFSKEELLAGLNPAEAGRVAELLRFLN